MKTWDEVRTAYQVARSGTVSGAASVLGVHHATVIRHIDALEDQLGVKLFQRHARGYTPTEAGLDLLQVAQAADDQFAQLAGRVQGRGEAVSGDLVVTSLDSLSPLLAPIFTAFRAQHPDVLIHLLAGDRLFRLEYGEAHVAIRAGAPPSDPDNVVQSLGHMDFALYAGAAYLDAKGAPGSEDDLAQHDFVGPEDPDTRAPFYRWLHDAVPKERIVFRTYDQRIALDAVRAGVGLGFHSYTTGSRDDGLTQVLPPREEWRVPLWLVTHVDLHRSVKVQAFLTFLKEAAKEWPTAQL
ncbi:LysR family transcriptional regulator [Palleronia sp. THAF1]|uniref:LysR family transcriptional regulator n=1 Tax=Palleronia sp. THAF1 TaxID=2587842 RepID=UPI000F53FAFB|nr:LysR family transcriptional regulator [Palleronia sp. THAF1]